VTKLKNNLIDVEEEILELKRVIELDLDGEKFRKEK